VVGPLAGSGGREGLMRVDGVIFLTKKRKVSWGESSLKN